MQVERAAALVMVIQEQMELRFKVEIQKTKVVAAAADSSAAAVVATTLRAAVVLVM